MSTLDRAFIKAFAETPTVRYDRPQAQTPEASHAAEPILHPIRGAQRRVTPSIDEPITAELVAELVPETRMTAPLSTFAAPRQAAESLRAAMEVDALCWPDACTGLIAHARRHFDRFADHLVEQIGQGHTRVAIASCARHEGRTTVTLALARHLAARGIHSVLVDADFENPMLAGCCELEPQAGWGDVVDGGLPLSEALIDAVSDGVTLLPWQGAKPHGAHARRDRLRAAAVFDTLAEHYDLVLVDTLPLASPAAIAELASLAEAIHLDAVYLVGDARGQDPQALATECAKLRRAGIPVVGAIENFMATAILHDTPPRPQQRAPRRQLVTHS